MLYYAVFYAKGGKAKEKVPSALNEAWILRDTFQREDGVTEDTVLYWILQLHILLSASSAIPDACIVYSSSFFSQQDYKLTRLFPRKQGLLGPFAQRHAL